MVEKYSKDQLWELYEKLPEELKEAIFSTKTADNINDTCVKNGVKDEGISEVARYTGWVLLGILSPDDFQITLEGGLKLSKELAKKISQEIDQSVFSPVRIALEKLYRGGVASPVETPRKEELPPSEGTDVYREIPE